MGKKQKKHKQRTEMMTNIKQTTAVIHTIENVTWSLKYSEKFFFMIFGWDNFFIPLFGAKIHKNNSFE